MVREKKSKRKIIHKWSIITIGIVLISILLCFVLNRMPLEPTELKGDKTIDNKNVIFSYQCNFVNMKEEKYVISPNVVRCSLWCNKEVNLNQSILLISSTEKVIISKQWISKGETCSSKKKMIEGLINETGIHTLWIVYEGENETKSLNVRQFEVYNLFQYLNGTYNWKNLLIISLTLSLGIFLSSKALYDLFHAEKEK